MPKPKRKKTVAPPALTVETLSRLIDGLVCVTEKGVITDINAAGRKLLGYPSKGPPVGLRFASHVMGTAQPKLGPQPKAVRLLSFSGEALEMLISAQRLPRSTATLLIGTRNVDAAAEARKAVEQNEQTSTVILAGEIEARTQELEQLSRQSRQILESVSEGIIAVDLDGRIRTANPSAAELFDRTAAAMTGLPLSRVFLYGSSHANAGQPVPIQQQLSDGPFHSDIEASLARTDGASFDAAYVISPITEARKVMGYVITLRDITERKRLAAEQRVAAAVFEQSSEGLCVADARGRLVKVNPAFEKLSGRAHHAMIGQPMADVLCAEAKQYRDAMDMLQKNPRTEWEQWVSAEGAPRRAWRIGLSVIRDDQGRTQQYAAIVSDVTARKVEEERILYQATYDQLTGLPNRTLFNDRLQRVVLEGRRAKSQVGLMFIDLDGFKAINDNLGHDAGDLLLKGTAERLLKCVRESDTVARLGGDEFTVIMPLLDSIEGATLVASRILKSLTTPFDLNGQEGRVSASIGISMFPAQAGDAQQLLHNADVAMYHAKRHGKANYQIWRQELEADAEARY